MAKDTKRKKKPFIDIEFPGAIRIKVIDNEVHITAKVEYSTFTSSMRGLKEQMAEAYKEDG